jgi:mono/diheme cytochrome c family protein
MTDAQFNAGTRRQPLGDAKAGVSADLDALAAYVSSLDTFDPSPHRQAGGALSAAAAEGKAVFTRLDCASCHAGDEFTRSDRNNPADIGTIKPASGQRLGGALNGIDVPTLRDVWATAPYLHDGSAPTLEAAVRAHNGLTVSDTDLPRLLAYLREIGSEEKVNNSPQAARGLQGRYYAGNALDGSARLSRVEAVNFGWGNGSPGNNVPADNFSARWTGFVTIPRAGTYRFRTVADDGVRLWVDSTRRILNWSNKSAAATTTSAGITFKAGQKVPVTLEYYENRQGAVVRLQWQTPGTSSYVPIPLSALSPD